MVDFIEILGEKYKIIIKKYEEDEAFERRSIDGYCDAYKKEIVICDMNTYKGWEHEAQETKTICQKSILRHEIVHAFLSESGLSDNSAPFDCGWAKNEEMVDWFALQGEKIYKAWKQADCI